MSSQQESETLILLSVFRKSLDRRIACSFTSVACCSQKLEYQNAWPGSASWPIIQVSRSRSQLCPSRVAGAGSDLSSNYGGHLLCLRLLLFDGVG